MPDVDLDVRAFGVSLIVMACATRFFHTAHRSPKKREAVVGLQKQGSGRGGGAAAGGGRGPHVRSVLRPGPGAGATRIPVSRVSEQ